MRPCIRYKQLPHASHGGRLKLKKHHSVYRGTHTSILYPLLPTTLFLACSVCPLIYPSLSPLTSPCEPCRLYAYTESDCGTLELHISEGGLRLKNMVGLQNQAHLILSLSHIPAPPHPIPPHLRALSHPTYASHLAPSHPNISPPATFAIPSRPKQASTHRQLRASPPPAPTTRPHTQAAPRTSPLHLAPLSSTHTPHNVPLLQNTAPSEALGFHTQTALHSPPPHSAPPCTPQTSMLTLSCLPCIHPYRPLHKPALKPRTHQPQPGWMPPVATSEEKSVLLT